MCAKWINVKLHFYPKHSPGFKPMLCWYTGTLSLTAAFSSSWTWFSFVQESSVYRTVWACTGTSSAQIKLEMPTVSPSSVLLSSPCWPHEWGASLSSVSNQTSIFQLKLKLCWHFIFIYQSFLVQISGSHHHSLIKYVVVFARVCVCVCVCVHTSFKCFTQY